MENKILIAEEQASDDYFFQKKVEMMIEMNNKKIANELTNVHSILNRLNSELSSIRQQVNDFRSRPPKAEQQTFVSSNAAVAVEMPKTQSIPKVAEERPKPRYGDYTPNDVQIEKFFYFGHK